MIDVFTQATRRILGLALREARLRGATEIGTHHLFIGLIQESGERTDSLTHKVLTEFGLTLERVRSITAMADATPTRLPCPLWFTRNAKRSLELALAETYSLERSMIDPEQLLIGLIESHDFAPSRTLYELGVSTDELTSRLRQLLRSSTLMPTTPT